MDPKLSDYFLCFFCQNKFQNVSTDISSNDDRRIALIDILRCIQKFDRNSMNSRNDDSGGIEKVLAIQHDLLLCMPCYRVVSEILKELRRDNERRTVLNYLRQQLCYFENEKQASTSAIRHGFSQIIEKAVGDHKCPSGNDSLCANGDISPVTSFRQNVFTSFMENTDIVHEPVQHTQNTKTSKRPSPSTTQALNSVDHVDFKKKRSSKAPELVMDGQPSTFSPPEKKESIHQRMTRLNLNFQHSD